MIKGDDLWRLRASHIALVVKNLPAAAGDIRASGSIPGSGRSPGGENDNTLRYSCLDSSVGRGTWGPAIPRGCNRARPGLHPQLCSQSLQAPCIKTWTPAHHPKTGPFLALVDLPNRWAGPWQCVHVDIFAFNRTWASRSTKSRPRPSSSFLCSQVQNITQSTVLSLGLGA